MVVIIIRVLILVRNLDFAHIVVDEAGGITMLILNSNLLIQISKLLDWQEFDLDDVDDEAKSSNGDGNNLLCDGQLSHSQNFLSSGGDGDPEEHEMLQSHLSQPHKPENDIALQCFEHIGLILIDDPGVDLIEHSHHKERMEKQRISQNLTLIPRIRRHKIVLLARDHASEVNENKVDEDLVGGLDDDHSPHVTLKHLLSSANPAFGHGVAAGTKCNSCQDIHHKINPKHLDDVEWQITQSQCTDEACDKH